MRWRSIFRPAGSIFSRDEAMAAGSKIALRGFFRPEGLEATRFSVVEGERIGVEGRSISSGAIPSRRRWRLKLPPPEEKGKGARYGRRLALALLTGRAEADRYIGHARSRRAGALRSG